jgi:organic radical activating enzyme
MTEPIRCWHFEHAYNAQVGGPCCDQRIPGVTNFAQMHSHPIYTEIKKNFDNGVWPQDYCNSCRDVEQTHSTKSFSKRAGSLHKLTQHQNLKNQLLELTVDAGRYCNIQCRTCTPVNSSSWIAEARQLVEINIPFADTYVGRKIIRKNIKIWPNNNYVEDDLSSVRYVDILGGEPLYNTSITEFLTRLLDQAGPNCSVYITTNGTVSYKNITILKEFQDAGLILSLDATQKAAEFIRTGCQWSTVKNNIMDYLSNGITISGYHPTYSVLNLYEISALRNFCNEHGFAETTETVFVNNPKYLNYSVLTDTERTKIIPYLKEHNLDFVADQISQTEFNLVNRNNFFTFMKHTKSYHNMDWQDYLPELYQLMNH